MQGQQRNRPVVSRNNPVIYLANSTCLYRNTYTLLSTLIFRFCHFYHPPTKFWDGNVFSRVCLSLSPQKGSQVTITHDALDLTTQGHCPTPYRHLSIQGPPCTWTPDMFKLVEIGPHCTGTPPPNFFTMKHVAGSWHPTGMLSCKLIEMFSFSNEDPPPPPNSYNHQSSNNGNNHLVCLRTYQILI